MISTDDEYRAAKHEVQELLDWWGSLTTGVVAPDPVTVSNIHTRLQKLHGEMAEFQRKLVLAAEQAIEDQR
jgi:hypothetical protein